MASTKRYVASRDEVTVNPGRQWIVVDSYNGEALMQHGRFGSEAAAQKFADKLIGQTGVTKYSKAYVIRITSSDRKALQTTDKAISEELESTVEEWIESAKTLGLDVEITLEETR